MFHQLLEPRAISRSLMGLIALPAKSTPTTAATATATTAFATKSTASRLGASGSIGATAATASLAHEVDAGAGGVGCASDFVLIFMTKGIHPVVGSQMGVFARLVILVHHVCTGRLWHMVDIVRALAGLGLSLAGRATGLEAAALLVASGRSTTSWATGSVVGVSAVARCALVRASRIGAGGLIGIEHAFAVDVTIGPRGARAPGGAIVL